MPALINKNYVIRFAVCSENATAEDIEYAWRNISVIASGLLTHTSIETSVSISSDVNNGTHIDYEQEVEEEDDSAFLDFDNDVIFDEQRTKYRCASLRRSTFQRMVSDPKCYDPKVRTNNRRRFNSESMYNPLNY